MGYRFRRTTLWLMGSLSVIAGVAVARIGWSLNADYVVACCIMLALRGWRRSWLSLFMIIVAGVGFGWWRGELYMQTLHRYQTWFYRPVTITAQAAEDGVYGQNTQLTFAAARICLPSGETVAGKMQISGFGLNAVFQGDDVQVTGKLYPSRGSTQARLSFAQLTLLHHHQSLASDTKRMFTAGLQSALPEPLASFALGLLIGQRATLPDDVKQALLMVGLTHIIAVSGYNLTIMLHASRGLLAHRSKRLATVLSLSLIFGFLALSGLCASIVRAAIVSVLSIWATYYGRTFKPLQLIMLAAAITAWANPFYLWGDASWYLSFLAFYGVLIVAPAFMTRLRRFRSSLVLSVAVESICAELMTLPYVLYAFGQMSFIALPANIAVVIFVPLAMLLSMIAGLAGMLVPNLAGWFAWPARLLLTYMLDIAHLFASLPHVFVQNVGLSMAWMLSFYGVILGLTLLARQRQKAAFLL